MKKVAPYTTVELLYTRSFSEKLTDGGTKTKHIGKKKFTKVMFQVDPSETEVAVHLRDTSRATLVKSSKKFKKFTKKFSYSLSLFKKDLV